jgi:hypothetical protein
VKGIDARVAGVDDRVKVVDDKIAEVIHGAQIILNQKAQEMFNLNTLDGKEAKRAPFPSLIGIKYVVLHIISENQLRENIHKWLSPPDPSTNHNIACGTHHKKTATWFFQGSIFREWKSRGSLLWIHGKRAPCLTQFLLMS